MSETVKSYTPQTHTMRVDLSALPTALFENARIEQTGELTFSIIYDVNPLATGTIFCPLATQLLSGLSATQAEAILEKTLNAYRRAIVSECIAI